MVKVECEFSIQVDDPYDQKRNREGKRESQGQRATEIEKKEGGREWMRKRKIKGKQRQRDRTFAKTCLFFFANSLRNLNTEYLTDV